MVLLIVGQSDSDLINMALEFAGDTLLAHGQDVCRVQAAGLAFCSDAPAVIC